MRIFVGAGVPKAGTSWLFDCISQHPKVSGYSGKELNYFNIKLRDDKSKDCRYIRRGFYSAYIEEFTRRFPKGNLLFLSFEDISRSPEKIITCTSQFLGVDSGC
jgi:hypothetical protein